MKKLLKYSVISVVSLIALIIIGLILLVTVVNPNRFKPFISKAVYVATGRTLTLAGDIKWKIYPNLGVTLNQVSLSNPPQFGNDPFVSVNQADVSVALIPLLSHHLVVKTLAVDGVDLNLVQNKEGNNWTFTPPNPESAPVAAGESVPATPLLLEMTELSLKHSNFSYQDVEHKQSYQIKDANLVVTTGFGGVIRFDQAQDELELAKVSISYNDQLQAALDYKISGLTTNPSYSGTIEVSKLKLASLVSPFKVLPAQYSRSSLLDNISFGGKISGKPQALNVQDFKFNFNQALVGNLNIAVTDFSKPQFKGSLQLDPFNLNQILDGLGLFVSERKDKPLLNKVAISSQGFSGNLINLSLSNLKLNLGDLLTINLPNLSVKNLANPEVSGALQVPSFNLNKTLDNLNIAVAARKDKPLLNNIALSSNFTASKTAATLTNLKLASGTSLNLTIPRLQVSNFANPQVAGSLNLGQTNLNQVLDGLNIAVAERKNKPLLNSVALSTAFRASPTSVALTDTTFNFGTSLRGNLNVAVNDFAKPQFSGSLNLPTFSANQVMQQLGMPAPAIANKKVLDNVAVSGSFSGGLTAVKLNNLRLKLNNTNFSGNLALNSLKPLAFTHNITIDNIDVADFSDLVGYHAYLRGIQLNGTARINPDFNLATLNGQQTMQIANITVAGISLDHFVLQLNNALNNASNGNGNDVMRLVLNSAQVVQAINKMKAEAEAAAKPGVRNLSQQTNLGKFNGNLQITNGVVNPSSFKLAGPSVAMSGNGQVNLVSKALAYQVNSQLLVNGVNPIFKKLVFATKVSGTTTKPSAEIDWGSLQQQLLKYAVEQNKQQIHNAVKEQINQAVGNQVNQALGNKNGNQAIDEVSKGVTNALGKLFGN